MILPRRVSASSPQARWRQCVQLAWATIAAMQARGALTLLALVAGCYEAPAGEPCSITCTTECPGDLTCSNGFCVGDGDVCAPQFVSVSTGGGFACGLDSQGALFCWGSNEHHAISESGELAF